MRRFAKWLALPLALVILALCLTGCFDTAESRQAREGKEMMEAYLNARPDAKKASVLTAYTHRYRPAADRIEMTELVQGKYRLDGQEYAYWINVKTGEIFTSERFAQLREVCYALMLRQLGLDGARCVGLCNPRFPDAPADTVMPAEIDDPEAYARAHLHSDQLSMYLWLVCLASEAPPNRWTAEDTADWNEDEAHICVMPSGEPLPELGGDLHLGYTYFQEFTGDKYRMSAKAVEFTPGQ